MSERTRFERHLRDEKHGFDWCGQSMLDAEKELRKELRHLDEFNRACDFWLRSRGLPTGVSLSSITTF
jgi:hypothetical protein